MATKKRSAVKKAIKKGGYGLFGGAARGMMGRQARLKAAMGGGSAPKKKKRSR